VIRNNNRLKFLGKVKSHRLRSCKHTKRVPFKMPGLIWVTLYAKDGRDVHRCQECLNELVGFVPMEARMLRKERVCCKCGETKKVIGFKTLLPVPEGTVAFACIDCFEEIGVEEGLANVQGW